MMVESTDTTSKHSDAKSDMLVFSTSSFLVLNRLRSVAAFFDEAVSTTVQIINWLNLIISYFRRIVKAIF